MGRRLPDIVEFSTRRFRELRNVVLHPFAVGKREALKKARTVYENAEVPLGKASSTQPKEAQNNGHQDDGDYFNKSNRSEDGRELWLEKKQTLTTQQSTSVQEISSLGEVAQTDESGQIYWGTPEVLFLSPGTELKGNQWYRYEIDKLVRDEAWVNWYAARNQADEPVIIQEYRLPDFEFHPTEIQDRQRAFSRLVNLNIKALNGPGEGRDFRLLRLIEAFSPPANQKTGLCYLVAKPFNAVPLRNHLQQKGPLQANEIREVLRQVLQTLEFLHSVCRIQFTATHMERGIPHGNLSLESLYIRQTDLPGVNSDRQFFIHVTDLLLWEHLIYPPSSPKFYAAIAECSEDLGNKADDLKALGRIGFELAGCQYDPDTGRVAEFSSEHATSLLHDEELHHFLCRLVEMEVPFKTASEALQAIPRPAIAASRVAETEVDFSEESFGKSADWRLPALAMTMLLMGITTWFILRNLESKMARSTLSPLVTSPQPELPDNFRLADAGSTLSGPLRYQIESGGALRAAVDRKITDSNFQQRLDSDKSAVPLMDELERRHPQLSWITNLNETRFRPRQQVIQFVERSPRHVGLVRTPETLPSALAAEAIAYDGLAILVPFQDFHNAEGNLADALGGYLSLEDLRQLYTSNTLEEVELKGIPVQLFFPDGTTSENQDTIQLFKEKVLNNNPEWIEKFDYLRQQAAIRDRTLVRELDINNNLYEKMFATYERSTESTQQINIGFDRLSRSFGQCTVYPLAIGNSAGAAIQPLQTITQSPINPEIDLCGAKERYSAEIPENYPLRYSFSLIYQNESGDGAAFRDIFKTYEAQYLLSEAGLTPIISRQEIMPLIWRDE